MDFDPVLLSRIQFAFTITFHILFPAFTIGLASWLAVIEWRLLRTGNEAYRVVYMFWSKIFAVAFGMGVVSGVAMIYQFGTNWSHFSAVTGNILAPLMGYEALSAFFLEASFLGIMLFGWNRVGPKLHFTATLMVAIGTLFSTFWIIAANSWMHTPAGYEIIDGIFYPTSWMEIIFNPSMPSRLVHMVLAAYLTTSLVVAGVGALYLLQGRFVGSAKIMFNFGLAFIMIAAPLQLFVGDHHGLVAFKHQPAKVAAMEGRWETMEGAPLVIFGIPDKEAETNHFEIAIPKLASLILTHDANGTVHGLKDFAKEDRPPVGWVFWCFRIMVGLGMLMIVMGGISLILRLQKKLYEVRWFQRFSVLMIPAGFISVLCGWYTVEIGRQPWIVYGLLRTNEMASPVPGSNVAISLAVFVIAYTVIFGAGLYYIIKLVRKGPQEHDVQATPDMGMHPLGYPQNNIDSPDTGKDS